MLVADSTFVCAKAINHVPTGCHAFSPDYHVRLLPSAPGSAVGTYCFRTSPEVRLGEHTVVVVSIVGPVIAAGGNAAQGLKGTPAAFWVPGAPRCGKGELEIDTDEIIATTDGVQVSSTGLVSFSFIVL